MQTNTYSNSDPGQDQFGATNCLGRPITQSIVSEPLVKKGSQHQNSELRTQNHLFDLQHLHVLIINKALSN